MTSNKRSMSDEGRSDSPTQARSYPRKRVSIACEVCRLRKTRCDAAKPACSFCSELGIECVYKRPTDASRPDPRSEELTHALKRLDKIEITLEQIATSVGAQERTHRNSSVTEISPFIGTPLAFRNEPVTPSPASVSTAAGKSASSGGKRRHACKMPNLLTFKHPMPEHSDWSWNCTEYFFNDQMETIADMRQHVNLPHPDPDLNDVCLGHLQRAFADHVLRWLPLFDAETATQHLRYAKATEYRHTASSLCIVFLIFANGAIASDSSLYSKSAHELPGFAYFARALSILDRLPTTSKDLATVQCRVLVTIYLLFAMRPLEAWKHITQASQECILLLRSNSINGASNEYREAFRRVYWICYVLENELEACLEVPSSGIRQYEQQVPLPVSHYEEEGMYFLLAFSSLRKVMVEVLDTVGYKSPSGLVTYNPAVALELRTQIDQWYHHLPGPLRFQLDGPMLFDTRKAYLRTSYYALMAVASWPFVLTVPAAPSSQSQSHSDQSRIQSSGPPPGPTSHPSQDSITTMHSLQSQSNGSPTPTQTPHPQNNPGMNLPQRELPMTDQTSCSATTQNSYTEASYRQAAQSCLSACRTYLTLAEEILTTKSLASHLVVRQYFAFVMILILTFPGVDLQAPASMEDRRLIETGMKNLRYWNVVPFMEQSLSAMVRIGRARGLRII